MFFKVCKPGCVPCKSIKDLTNTRTWNFSRLEVIQVPVWIVLPALPWPSENCKVERWTTFHSGWCQKIYNFPSSFLGLQTQLRPVPWSVLLLSQWLRNSKVLQTCKDLLHSCLCLCSEARNYVSNMIKTIKLFLGQILPFAWCWWHFLTVSNDYSTSSLSCFRTRRALTSCKLHYKLQDFSVNRDGFGFFYNLYKRPYRLQDISIRQDSVFISHLGFFEPYIFCGVLFCFVVAWGFFCSFVTFLKS